MHSSDLLERSKRSVLALRKRMERLQRHIRRLYQSADWVTGKPMTRTNRNATRD